MDIIANIREKFHELQSAKGSGKLKPIEQHAFNAFDKFGIPVKHEEWKYTRISNVFNRDYKFAAGGQQPSLTNEDIAEFRLPGYAEANELVFVNGNYSADLSVIRSAQVQLLSLHEAAEHVDYCDLVLKHVGHSSTYLKDGVNALNTAFIHNGVFLYVSPGKVTEHPVYIYNITDGRQANVLSQPRTLFYVSERAELQIVETYLTIGQSESFTNQVMEIIVEKEAVVHYCKIQNDKAETNQVSTTHFRQIGKSYVHAVTITLNGGVIRNNLNMVMEAERSESHMYGLYFIKGHSHVDNHTVVDNVKPHCLSNELYKGIIDDNATAVFNGKIFVQQIAQKTNAYQSNKNILLSDGATVNTKPQLEIFADDVKCSHGCTVGRLDEEGLFYLRSRGISEKIARSLLVHAFAVDILEHIKAEPIRNYVDELISQRLEFNIA
jgi:Fe-S cluster assembly protein SufD